MGALMETIGNRLFSLKVLSVITCIILNPLYADYSLALQPPRPGELKMLKDKGLLEERLAAVKRLGNHRLDPFLVNKLKTKLQPMIGIQAAVGPEIPSDRPGLPSTGDIKTFTLLIEFNDETQSFNAATIDAMMYGAGDPNNFPRESLANFYDRSSYGLLDLSNGATFGWYKTDYDRSTIAETVAGREGLIIEALDSFDSSHDFSQYDNDGDGFIDYFLVIWTGPKGAWGTFWWAKYIRHFDTSYSIDGVQPKKYSWQWEKDTPDVIIHETGHALGLPDYYDYDDTVGPDGGVGGFDMMHSNQFDHNCFSKFLLGWLEPTIIWGGAKHNLTLDDTASSEDAVLIWQESVDFNSEFFMVQNRQNVGNDTNAANVMDGLAVWHVDATLTADGTEFVSDNSYTTHKVLRLMEADGLEEIETSICLNPPADPDVDPWGTCSIKPGISCKNDNKCKEVINSDLYQAGATLAPFSFPNNFRYSGRDSCVSIEGIIDNGTYAGATIDAYFSSSCDTYVDWRNILGAESGSFAYPFNTVIEGVTTVFSVDTLRIAEGNYPESLLISRPMLIRGYNGSVVIGTGN
jgi:M6 family metalloprotease-like protein